ncbi:uncharacterized protein PHALS_15358 [Plasmopara halstedii]|uniref:Uncharacterized protein n=1 Tax=Plasmopara halstedii TaxID=4781 RepID=A0A0P1ADM5_PLAHL|nr:uncharacterized protein PHALS_15358 [Plasmopara halstedii]CEG39121.1 hypothetical protein PHALS_15358 [Plasmopara halstedii]|eukprot:XP_024575490.1 hypothetical protein PHALS_15358 [Plasmopara halstedii]
MKLKFTRAIASQSDSTTPEKGMSYVVIENRIRFTAKQKKEYRKIFVCTSSFALLKLAQTSLLCNFLVNEPAELSDKPRRNFLSASERYTLHVTVYGSRFNPTFPIIFSTASTSSCRHWTNQ